ncbi:MAG: response regulator [Candidatus Nealsonbacteria bacterium]|nr:response regulator [Candidatus Nealsonbacteria bacterium]
MNKILIAFHDNILRESYYEDLKENGFDVVGEANGKAVLDLVKEQKPNLILLDVNLIGLSGFEVMSKIKSDDDIKKIPVIIFGHYEDPVERQRAMDAGAIDYLAFSVMNPLKIVNKVKIVLGEQRGYSIKISKDDNNLKALLEDMGYDLDFVCAKCGAQKELFLIRNLECGKNSFLASFVCPNNCV